MSELSLGSLSIDPNTNRVRVGSISSGIDTEALTNALVDAKKIPALRLEQRISEGEAKVAAYGDLRSALRAMQSALDGLRNPPGLSSVEDNLFERKEAFFSSNTTTSPASLLGIQASNRAATGSFDLVISGLATAHKVMSNAFADPASTGLQADTLTIGLGGGDTDDVAVTAGMTLYELRDAINTTTGTTDVKASVLKVADNDHRLVLTGTVTGTGNTVAVAANAANTALLGLALPANQLEAADNAHLLIDDIPVQRTTNTVTDLFEGLTIDLYQADPGTTVTVEVEPSFAAARDQVLAFADAYNAMRDIAAAQNAVADTGAVDRLASPLFGDSLLRTVTQSVTAETTAAVKGLDPAAVSTLAQLGLTLGEDNRMQVDTTVLDAKLLADPEAARRVFEFDAQISDPQLSIFGHGNAFPANSFTITKSGADWVLDDGTNSLTLEADGTTLSAPEGSAYDGLVLFWVGAGDPTGPITVNATQGIADRLHNLVESAANELDGSIASAMESTEGQIERWREDVAKIDARAEDYRLVLVEKFARLETALSLADAMLKQVRAQTDAMTARE
ncbi:MAG: flagellar filament capping protein FliD [Pseudomonadota bacterium]